MSWAAGSWFLVAAVMCGVACGGAEFGSAGSGGSTASGGVSVNAGSGGAPSEAGSSSRAGSGGRSAGRGGDGGEAGSTVQPSGGAAGTAGSAGAAGGAAGAGGKPDVTPVNECPCAAPRPTCEEGRCVVRGPSMVKATSFYVDSTEVTVKQYEQFLAAKEADTSGQAAECAWNDSFVPSVKGKAADHPVTHVDYCDAAAYCAWADKQLCGKIGGGPLSFQDLASPTKSQWFAACGGTKAQPYPYGSSFQAGACNSSTNQLAEVGSLETCAGFYEGVLDMVGNVAEWVNACDASQGAVDGCETIGGSYAESGTCTLSSLKHRDEQLPTVGFRCCSR